MFEMTNENFARLLNGLTIAVGNRKNRILFYQFLAAEIRVPSRVVLEFGDAISGISRVSGQAARSIG